MKRIISTILLIFTLIAAKANLADSLKTANDYYAANEIEKAIAMYESIVSQGYESAALYYNLGNSYYKNSNLVNAILNYERAKKLAPRDEDILFNLELANQFVIDKIEALPQPFFVKWGNAVVRWFKVDTWAVISLSAFILTLIMGLAFAFLRSRSLRKLSFGLAIALLVLSGSSFAFATKQKTDNLKKQSAIIFSPSVTVKASPNESSVDLFVIHEGLKVEILKNHNYWLEIKLDDGNRGWLKKEALKII